MTSAFSRTISSPLSRRNNNNNYYHQTSTADSSNLSDSLPLFIYTNPLVTIVYSTTSTIKGICYNFKKHTRTHVVTLFFYVSLRALSPLTVKKKETKVRRLLLCGLISIID